VKIEGGLSAEWADGDNSGKMFLRHSQFKPIQAWDRALGFGMNSPVEFES
jgi:hypothetical protein